MTVFSYNNRKAMIKTPPIDIVWNLLAEQVKAKNLLFFILGRMNTALRVISRIKGIINLII
jgi:hypothetical protein